MTTTAIDRSLHNNDIEWKGAAAVAKSLIVNSGLTKIMCVGEAVGVANSIPRAKPRTRMARA